MYFLLLCLGLLNKLAAAFQLNREAHLSIVALNAFMFRVDLNSGSAIIIPKPKVCIIIVLFFKVLRKCSL